jgi:RNA polymerase sigma-70 factor, ECF subfamily
LEDGEIVRRIAAGDKDAEAEFCRRFGPRVRLYGLRHLNGNEDATADLVQSVLLSVLEAARAGRIEQPDIVARFVLGTCRNTTLRTRADQEKTQPVDAQDPVFDAATVEVPRFDRLDTMAVMRCMYSLDERSRTVLMLSFEAEREAEEIATLLDTSAGNVRVIRHRALGQLRTCVEGGHHAAV